MYFVGEGKEVDMQEKSFLLQLLFNGMYLYNSIKLVPINYYKLQILATGNVLRLLAFSLLRPNSHVVIVFPSNLHFQKKFCTILLSVWALFRDFLSICCKNIVNSVTYNDFLIFQF